MYLDQNHWSLLSAARFGHRAVPAAVAAAGQLMQWANDGRVLVPASAAHFTETVPRYGIPRVASATAILQVSRGWQMRNPVHVRLEEIRRRLAGAVGDAREVFAPQADGFFSMRSDASRQASAATAARVLTAVPSIIALYDTLLETEAIPDHGAVAETAACAWAQKWASLATELHAHRESVSTVRRIVTAALIEDLIDDVIRAALAHGTTPEAGHRVPRGRR